MNLISRPNLFAAARETRNPQLAEKVARWYDLVSRNSFSNFVELKMVFPSVDLVKDRLVFNLGSHRLICGFSFARKTFFFKALLSHAEYEKGVWRS